MMTKSRAKNTQWLRLCFCGLRGWEAPPSEVSEWVTQQMCQGLGRKNKLNNSSLGTRPRVPLFVVIKIRVGIRLSNEKEEKRMDWHEREDKKRVFQMWWLWFPLQFIFLIYMKIQDPLFFWIVLQDVCILQKTEMFEECLVFSSLAQNIKYVHINNIKLQAILMADLVLKKWTFFFPFLSVMLRY